MTKTSNPKALVPQNGKPVPARALVPAPAISNGLVASAPAPVREYLAETLGVVDFAGSDEDSLWAISARGEQMEMAGRLITGLANRELVSRVAPQKLSEELRKRGKPRRTFYYAIQVLDAFEALPDAQCVHSLALVGFTRVREILVWTPEERTRFAAGEEVRGLTVQDAVGMSVADLQKTQREWESENNDKLKAAEREAAKLRNQLDIVTKQNEMLARAGQALQTESDLPNFALVVRQESMALTEQMSFCMDNLQAITEEFLFHEVKHPEAHRYQPVAACTAYYALAGIEARVQALLTKLKTEFKSELGMVKLEHQLSPAEQKRFLEQREMLLAQHTKAAKARDDKRENNRPGKRGAKRK